MKRDEATRAGGKLPAAAVTQCVRAKPPAALLAIEPSAQRRARDPLLCLFALVGLLLAPLVWGQMTPPGVVKKFKLPEFYQPVPGKIPPNRLKTLIIGAEARPQSRDLVDVIEMWLGTYQIDGRTNVIAKAPQCWVDLEKRHVWSTGRLEVLTADGRMSMTGSSGFYCQMTNFNMVISNHVRTVIHHAMLNSTNL